MGETTLYRKPTGYDDPKLITWRPVVPVEPDYEAMVEAGRKANIDLVPEECEMLFRAGIGDTDDK